MPDVQPPDLPRSPSRPPGRGRPLPRPGLDPAAALEEHQAAMYASARRVSLCDDDAHDAVQAAAERFLKHQHRVDPATVAGWLITVARREGLRVRQRRVRTGAIDDDDHRLVHEGDGPDDVASREEDVALAREALARLKPQERLALWMQAEGRSYEEIAEELSWSRTKVNRNITEGRARLRKALAGLATGEACAAAGPRIDRLAAGGATADDLRELRPHLRRCTACRGRLRRARGGRWSIAPPVLLAWLPWAGRTGGAPAPPVRTRVTELVADRLAVLVPSSAGAVTEAGLAVTTGLAVVALGAGVATGGGAADEPEPRERGRVAAARTTASSPAARPAGPVVTPVSAARSSLTTAVSSWSAADRRAAAQRREAAERRRAAERRAARRAEERRAARRRAAAAARSRASAAAGSVAGPATGAATAPAPSTGATPVAPTPSTGGGTSGGGSGGGAGSAADEFGFE